MIKKLIFIQVLLFSFSVLAEVKQDNFIGKWTYDFKGVKSFVEYVKGGTVIYGKESENQFKANWSVKENILIIEGIGPDGSKFSEKSKIVSIKKNKIILKDSFKNTIILIRGEY